MDPTPHPWDQRDGEPAAAYARFLSYRNLGPARSLDAAYAAHTGVAKGGRRRKAPGSWQRESDRWEWTRRAGAWDVAVLSEAGRQTVVAFVAVLHEYARVALAVLADGKAKPKSWSEVSEAISVLGAHVSPETIRDVSDRAGDPAPGRPRIVG